MIVYAALYRKIALFQLLFLVQRATNCLAFTAGISFISSHKLKAPTISSSWSGNIARIGRNNVWALPATKKGILSRVFRRNKSNRVSEENGESSNFS